MRGHFYNGKYDIPEEFNLEQMVDDHYKLDDSKNYMNSGLFKLSWTDVLHAVVFGIVTGLVAVGMFILKAGTFFGIDFHTLVNVGGLATLGTLVGLIVPFLTTANGNLVGIFPMKK